MLNGKWSDFISDFMSLTEHSFSPEIFRLWAGISLVAGALERRVWVKTRGGLAYPNLYVLLVAPPGVGKRIIEDVRALWRETTEPGQTRLRAFRVAPDQMTKAALMDTLAKAKQVKLVPNGPAITYHSLLIGAEEFSVLLPTYDMEYIGALNSIYENKATHEESRRYGKVQELVIENPQLNILGGIQPSYMASLLPEDAWATGLARRLLMIYSTEIQVKDLIGQDEDEHLETVLRPLILAKLSQFSGLYGQMLWAPGAIEFLNTWHKSGQSPKPTHSKLAYYNNSRTVFLLKLSMISAVARTGTLVIDVLDVKRAMHWLFEAEALMPDIFRSMIGKSDRQVIEELHLFMLGMQTRARSKTVDGGAIRQFLIERMPQDKIESLIATCERANIIARVAGTQDTWVPRPRFEHNQVLE